MNLTGMTAVLQVFVIDSIFAKSVILHGQYSARNVCYMIVEMTARSINHHDVIDMNANLMFATDVQRKVVVTKTDTFTVQEKLMMLVKQDILIPEKVCG